MCSPTTLGSADKRVAFKRLAGTDTPFEAVYTSKCPSPSTPLRDEQCICIPCMSDTCLGLESESGPFLERVSTVSRSHKLASAE
jgi:hypothetical protein